MPQSKGTMMRRTGAEGALFSRVMGNCHLEFLKITGTLFV